MAEGILERSQGLDIFRFTFSIYSFLGVLYFKNYSEAGLFGA